MLHAVASAIAVLCGVVALAGTGYLFFALMRVRIAARPMQSNGGLLPPISVLKPLCGLEPELYENLRSFCEQDYPAFQIVFCCRDSNDPALAQVRRLIEEFPNSDLCLVVDDSLTMPNPKIANLAAGYARARYDLLVVADADIRVDSRCLRAIGNTFADDRVGAASCLYRGLSAGGIASDLGALHINDYFIPSVLVASAIEPVRFCLGATMAVRRGVLEALGGLEVLGDHLGDDYVLGNLTAARGAKVEIVPYTVTCIVQEPTFSDNFNHLLRWARTIRKQRPLGYGFMFVTMPLPFALLSLVFSYAPLAVALLAVTAAARFALHVVVRRASLLREPSAAWLVPFADSTELAVWVSAFFGNAVRWRTREYSVGNQGQVR